MKTFYIYPKIHDFFYCPVNETEDKSPYAAFMKK